MNRETVEKAVREYAEENLFYPEDIYNDSDIREMNDCLAYAYKAGAEWRINSVWHDASEKYEIRLPSVVVFKNGRAVVYLDLRDVTYDGLWDEVKEYAYLKDLRPDRKENER